jgi:ornithine cyclodeaminase/alanine dehydrogenase-like protein (mu-crystallin family)
MQIRILTASQVRAALPMPAAIDAIIGEIINGSRPGRRSDDQITLFKTVGVAVQDVVAAARVLARAEAGGIGTVVDLGA